MHFKKDSGEQGIYIGLMSGTSVDSVDAVAVTFGDKTLSIIGTRTCEIPASLRQNILDLSIPGKDSIHLAGETDTLLGHLFADATLQLLSDLNIEPIKIIAIGSHGQTIRHQPPSENNGFTVQIGDPNIIAAKTGCAVVADFRRADMAAGGQGAPLVPAFHNFLFQSPKRNRIIINIGGIANITILSTHGECFGFDTGPGNLLLDAWCQKKLGKPYDDRGQWAERGEINPEVLDQLLKHPFFNQKPPKSTGREAFNLSWLTEQVEKYSLSPTDLQATLTALTAKSIVDAISKQSVHIHDIYICGGGAFNDALVRVINSYLQAEEYPTAGLTSDIGLHPKWVEACAFAWLAKQRLDKKSGNLPQVTGASRAKTLGGVYLP
jgi:anhydro-N-acetylmuramic acid kinase